MPIDHRFLQTTFGPDFATQNAILDITPYKPEVLFIGTYNPDTNVENGADFFYGRSTSWFWPTMNNIFVHGQVVQLSRRQPIEEQHPALVNPTLPQIFDLCARTKMTFADLIKKVLHNEAPAYNLQGNIVTYQGVDYNLIDDNALAQLNTLNQVDWATKEIIDFLLRTPSISCVRLTRQPTGVWQQQWNQIKDFNYGRLVNFGTIHTPSAMGLHEAGIAQATALARRWIFHPITSKRLCDQWLHNHQVPVNNFNYPNPPLPLL